MVKKIKEQKFSWRCDAIIQKYDSNGSKKHLQVDCTDDKETLRLIENNDETFFKIGDIYIGTLKLEREGTTPTHIEDYTEPPQAEDD